MKLIFIVLTLSVISANAQFNRIGNGCTVSGKCVTSLNYGSAPYGPNENCEVEVNVEFGVFEMNAFRTENYWDVLSVLDVNGDDRLEWSGFSEIPNFSVEMGEKLKWASDYSTQWEGFNVCLAEPCTYGEANDVDCACTDAIIKQPPFALCTAANGLYCDAGTGTCGAGDACLNIDGSAANNVDCACGTAVSNSVNGRFCDKAHNVVSDFSIQECPYTDGYTLNEPKCTCGTAHTDSVNVFCDKAHNRVSASVYCLYTDGSELNEATCTCGTTLCEKAATGLYCDAGTCGAGDECLNIDGLTANNVDCACGTAVSNSVNGRFCDKAHNRVSASVYCLHTDGSALNEATCMCGTTLCTADSGLICYEGDGGSFEPEYEGGLGSCRKKALGAFGFGYTIEDDCTQAGSYQITDRYMCETAANSLTLMIDKYAIVASWPDEPSGCYSAATVLKYNPFDVSHVDFEDAACVSEYSGFCLCIVAAACTDGALANDDACMCDTALCTAEFSGLYCDAGTCGAGDACLNIDGSAANNVDCACGTAVSNSVNGRFCEKSYNFVSDSSIQECLNTDGSAPNEATCTCGNTLCTADSGLICYEGGLGSCRKEGLGAFGFGLVGFGPYNFAEECESDPGSYTIIDPEMCATAAKSLLNTPGRPYTPGVSLNVVIINENDDYRQPSGCYYDDYAIGSSRPGRSSRPGIGDELFYNDNPARHGGMCNGDDGISDFCLCIVAAACTEGAFLNDDACMCDTALCTAATGLYCDAGTGTCGAGNECLNIDGLTANNVDCACGTAVSNSVNGRFCKKSYNVVSDSSIQECLNTDGSAPNEAATCTCGTALTDSVNVFCDKAHNRVSASVYCLHTDGSALNEATCTCGNTLCTADSGLICYEGGLGSCRKEGLGAFGFGYTIEDNCTQAGSYPITALEMCATAANSRVSTLEVIGGVLIGSMGPTGCYRNVNTMRYNDNPESTEIACQSVYSRFCLCIVAAACTEGAFLNDDACMCDTALCTAATGLYCDAGTGTCGAGNECPNIDGLTANNVDCACGTAVSNSVNGRFCDAGVVRNQKTVTGCRDATALNYYDTCKELNAVYLATWDDHHLHNRIRWKCQDANVHDETTCVYACACKDDPDCQDYTVWEKAFLKGDMTGGQNRGCKGCKELNEANNYDEYADEDDGTCEMSNYRCIDSHANNYDEDEDKEPLLVDPDGDYSKCTYDICPAGMYQDSGGCKNCAYGTVSAKGSTECADECPAGTGEIHEKYIVNAIYWKKTRHDGNVPSRYGRACLSCADGKVSAKGSQGPVVDFPDFSPMPDAGNTTSDEITCSLDDCPDFPDDFPYKHGTQCLAECPSSTYKHGTVCLAECPEGTSVNGDGTVCTSCLEEEQNWISGGCDCGGGNAKSPEWCTEQKRIWADKGCNSQCSSNE